MASRQFFIPGDSLELGVYINADSNGREWFIPGLGMFNEEAAVAVTGVLNLIMAPYRPA